MIRRRLLGGLIKMKVGPEILNFAYGIKKTITEAPYLYETGTITGNNPVAVTRNNKTYYKLVGRGAGLSNIAFVNFKTHDNNQTIQLHVFDECDSPNDFFAVCKLDDINISTLQAKLTGGQEQTIRITVPEAGSHFIKIYYYQHVDNDPNLPATTHNTTHAGYFRLEPYYNQYEWGYDNPVNQTIKIKSYYGWTLTSKPDWITLDKNSDRMGTKQVFINASGNPGNSRTGTITFTENQTGDTAQLIVNQEANPHPNDIILKVEKAALTNEVNKDIVIGVQLVGNTSYTITNNNQNIYNISPMSGTGDITIKNINPATRNQPIRFNITGNFGISKDIEIWEDNNITACYCDCNNFNGCDCDRDTTHVHKDIQNCLSESSWNCPIHCEAYGGSSCGSHDSCLSQCKSVCSPEEAVCHCQGAYGDCPSYLYTPEDCSCQGAEYPCDMHGYTKYGCSCHGAYGDCSAHEYTKYGCSCQGAYGDCPAHGLTGGSCSCNGMYGDCPTHGLTRGGCSCHGLYGDCSAHGYNPTRCSCYGAKGLCGGKEMTPESCSCQGAYGECYSHGVTYAACSCNGVYGYCQDRYTPEQCSCHGLYGDCPTHGYTPTKCSCYGAKGLCGGKEMTPESCSCHGAYATCMCYNGDSYTCSETIACRLQCKTECNSECTVDCNAKQMCEMYCAAESCVSKAGVDPNDMCMGYCQIDCVQDTLVPCTDCSVNCLDGTCSKTITQNCSCKNVYGNCWAHEYTKYGCSCQGQYGDCPAYLYTPESCSCHGAYGDCSSHLYTKYGCSCHGAKALCYAHEYTKAGCSCQGMYGDCSAHEYTKYGCSCQGQYGDCPAYLYTPESCSCHGAYGDCSSHRHTPERCSCQGMYGDCPSHLYTKYGCSCQGQYGDCSAYLYTPESCSCHGAYGDCSAHEYTKYGCSCQGAYGDCPAHGLTGGSCSCNGMYGDCPTHGLTRGGCSCHGLYGDCSAHGLTRGGCSCQGAYGWCPAHEYTASHCSCKGAKYPCQTYLEDCDKTLIIGTNDNNCSCNDKTYYPHCECDNYCPCQGYVIPQVG